MGRDAFPPLHIINYVENRKCIFYNCMRILLNYTANPNAVFCFYGNLICFDYRKGQFEPVIVFFDHEAEGE